MVDGILTVVSQPEHELIKYGNIPPKINASTTSSVVVAVINEVHLQQPHKFSSISRTNLLLLHVHVRPQARGPARLLGSDSSRVRELVPLQDRNTAVPV